MIFTSDTRYSLLELPATMPTTLDRASNTAVYASGNGRKIVRAAPTVVITRNLMTTRTGTQTFVPKRFLAGMLPSALLDPYEFW